EADVSFTGRQLVCADAAQLCSDGARSDEETTPHDGRPHQKCAAGDLPRTRRPPVTCHGGRSRWCRQLFLPEVGRLLFRAGPCHLDETSSKFAKVTSPSVM